MDVAQLVVKCLETEGATYVFGVPGEENEDLLFALEQSEQLRFIPCRHEQGAAFIANVWGRLTGRAGICLSTLGPGATNLLTGVADANFDKAPVVAITGQGASGRLHHESHQAIDIVSLFQPVTKWNSTIRSPEVVTEVVRKAFKLAELEKPGATHIELPEDIAAKQVAPPLPEPIRPQDAHSRPLAAGDTVDRLVTLLAEAERPLILAGNGAVRKKTSAALCQLVEKTNVPVVSTFMGKGAIEDHRPQSLFAVGLGFKDYVADALEAADLILTIGYDIAEYSPDDWNIGLTTRIIHLDYEPAEVYASYQPALEVIGDVAGNLQQVLDHPRDLPRCESWYADVRKRIDSDLQGYAPRSGTDFTVPSVLHLLRDVLADDGLVISDVGAHKMWISRNFPTYCPNGCIISNGLASMGISLPGGIAASLVNPDRQIVSLMGDGGFMMNVQELETAVRVGAKYTIIVFNDNDYGLISWKQEQSRGTSTGTRLGNPDFVALAESFGIPAARPADYSELRDLLTNRLTSGMLNLIEIPVNTDVNQELVQKLKAYWNDK